jgi:hypothetical protein
MELKGKHYIKKKITTNDFAQSVFFINFEIEVELIQPSERIWLEPSLIKEPK